MTNPIRYVTVTLQPADVRAIHALTEEMDNILYAGEAHSHSEALALIQKRQPDVILLAIDSLSEEDWATLRQVSELAPESKTIVLSAVYGEEPVLKAFRNGARGYLQRGATPPAEIVDAIRSVARGGAVLKPDSAGWILDQISRREGRQGSG